MHNKIPGGAATDKGGAVKGLPDPSLALRTRDVDDSDGNDDDTFTERPTRALLLLRALSSSLDRLPNPLALVDKEMVVAGADDDDDACGVPPLPLREITPADIGNGGRLNDDDDAWLRAGDAVIDAVLPNDNDDMVLLDIAPAVPVTVIGDVALVLPDVINIGEPGTMLPLLVLVPLLLPLPTTLFVCELVLLPLFIAFPVSSSSSSLSI